MSDEPGGSGQKLFPRNTTARAARVVRGNPVVSRPEDGVENCFPGLEFDQRNLDKVFFPGLVFEFHHGLGAFVRAVEPDLLPAALRPLAPTAADIEAGLFLFWLGGVREGRIPDPAGQGLAALSDLRRLGDLDVWRVVRDVEPGPVQLVLAPASRFGAGGAFEQTADRMVRAGQDRVLRDPAGAWQLGLLTGSRARFLTEDGVLDPALLAAGDLTRSLCAPWQYDFADCGCFYWAANKPDMAASPSQPRRILPFQRLDRSRDAERRPIGDVGRWEQIRGGTDPNATMDHADVIRQWEDLPFVVAETETDRFAPRPAPSPPELLGRAEVVRRLRYLAGVEHALSVEYLYAFYSLAAPRQRPAAAGDPAGRVFTAAEEVFRVAVDEMRHLRWVNEVLGLLGEPLELGRAGIIGEDLDGDGRAFQRPFELLPLTPAQLQWFVDVEDRSNDLDPGGNDDSVDGMYTRILLGIQQGPEFAGGGRERLAHLVKLVIDEGVDHFQRFRRAQEALAGLDPGTYLRLAGPPGALASGHPDADLQRLADANYAVVLDTLDWVLRQDDAHRGQLLEGARRAMFNLDDACHLLASRGHGALFSLPPAVTAGPAAAPAAVAAGRTASPVMAAAGVGAAAGPALDRLATGTDAETRALAERCARRLAEMRAVFAAELARPVPGSG